MFGVGDQLREFVSQFVSQPFGATVTNFIDYFHLGGTDEFSGFGISDLNRE